MYKLPLIVFLLLPVASLADQPAPSPWQFLNFFVGQWRGTTQGEPGHGTGERSYEFVLQGKFLQLKNKSVYLPQEKNPKGEIHEDLGLYSYDKKQKKYVYRQFHVEGFVNEYVEQERSTDGKRLVLVTSSIENIPDGWHARETYTINGPDEYTEVFELAAPGKDFALYSEGHWKRVK